MGRDRVTGVCLTNRNLAVSKEEPIRSEKTGSWGGAGALAVEPLARRGGSEEGERRREPRLRGLVWRSWGEGVLLGRVGCGGQLTRLCGIREGACFLILVGPLMRDFEADSRL